MRRLHRYLVLSLAGSLVLGGAVSIGGCSSPTAPVSAPIVFQGEVVFEGAGFHILVLESAGTVQIELTSLTARLVASGSQLAIGLGLGRVSGDECSTTFNTTATEGNSFSFGLQEGQEYCVRVFDTGILPQDAVVAYTVTVIPAG